MKLRSRTTIAATGAVLAIAAGTGGALAAGGGGAPEPSTAVNGGGGFDIAFEKAGPGGPPGGGLAVGFGKADHPGPSGAVADYLGLTEDELRAQLESGKTLAQIASAQGKSV